MGQIGNCSASAASSPGSAAERSEARLPVRNETQCRGLGIRPAVPRQPHQMSKDLFLRVRKLWG